MGVRSIDWFKSYLSGRTQIVDVNNTFSSPDGVKCGVPQGSILGPLLFLCYVNDMTIGISKDTKLLLYADDSAIIFSHKNPDVIARKLGSELENCSKWLVDNKLSLHLGKTECVVFGSKRKLKKISQFSISCNGIHIKAQKSVKYLGQILDDNMSGETSAEEVIKKANSRLKFLYRQKKFLNMNLKKTLCSALIQCHYDYACSSWFFGLSKKLKQRLQISQNKMLRYIFSYGPRVSLEGADFRTVGMLKVEDRVKQLSLNHVHKIWGNRCPSYLNDHFIKVTSVHNHYTRKSQYNFHVPTINSISSSTFYYNAILAWNSLPKDIQSILKYNTFKKEVKQYMLEKY